mmetsp:Transcript_21446/g.46605  ORF Transcript_21446/g.46605 Transcript_21446/m.46605 type:complete len:561 (-) Transcript_21446:360-2042(-)
MKLFIASTMLTMGFSAVQLTPLRMSKQLVDGSNDNVAANDAAYDAPSFPREIKSYDSDNAVSLPHKATALDIGILRRKQDTPDNGRRLAAKCQFESIMCEKGTVRGISCAEACDGSCCVEDMACQGFTGELCMDNATCIGEKSCYYGNIGIVVGGCKGDYACASYYGYGSIDGIFNSCIDERSCAYAADKGGAIGAMLDSCHGEKSCYSAGYNYGDILGIYSSCNGTAACIYTAAYGGSIGAITSSCLQSNACERTSACDVDDSQSCDSIITEISDSCDGPNACNKAAFNGGSIAGISNSCVGSNACLYAAFNGGYIGGIRDACNASNACLNAGVIPSGMENCCYVDNGCLGVTESTLPEQCEKALVTNSTTAPSQEPNVPVSTMSNVTATPSVKLAEVTPPPSKAPTASPSTRPTDVPTTAPSQSLTNAPTAAPSNAPSTHPTSSPSKSPTSAPTTAPSLRPTLNPTIAPSKKATTAPIESAAASSTTNPTGNPSMAPEVRTKKPKAKAVKKKSTVRSKKSKAVKDNVYKKRLRKHRVFDAESNYVPANLRSASDQQRV